MKVGTKSILFGAHCFFIHPFYVAWAWWKLYGFPWDYRLWVAFFVHDLGYWGKPNMDGDEGETHPELGANLMHKWFDGKEISEYSGGQIRYKQTWDWYNFCLLHSRFYAKKYGRQVSKLCAADKLAFCLEWRWFYLLRVKLSDEIQEYKIVSNTKNHLKKIDDDVEWFEQYKQHLLDWIVVYKLSSPEIWEELTVKATIDAVKVGLIQYGDSIKKLREELDRLKLLIKPLGFEEGDTCNMGGCEGTLGFEPVQDCQCHISPPCHKCVDNPLVCLECGRKVE